MHCSTSIAFIIVHVENELIIIIIDAKQNFHQCAVILYLHVKRLPYLWRSLKVGREA